jgi:C4-dicarboxylate-specific signal transduction histidine kinase
MVALCADGSELPVEVDLVPIHLESRSVCAVYLHDISRRKRAEQEIGNLARFASESPTPILRVGRRGVILYANVASEPLLRYWGVGRGQTLPLYWCNLVFETLAGRVHTEREITSGTRIYSLLLAPVVDLDYVNIYGRDITEVRLAEQQARRHQAELVHVCRLSTMGEMSTGMAHELNQPLAAIVNFARGSTRRLQAGIGGEKAIMEALEQISIQAERAAEIIRRLRNLVTRQPPVRSTVNMNDLVREVCSFVEYEARKLGIEIQLQLSREDLPVRVDLVQIEQVMLNLIRNAMDALQEVPMKRRALAIETGAHGSDSVRVAVKDSGSGIAAADMRQLFDPFFTTKSSGMGMGLPISKTIIDDHGGTISARSLAGQGTEFTVILPTYLHLADMKERLGTG